MYKDRKHSPTKNHIAPFEVVIHNTKHDCWVSLLGKVLDITNLIKEFENEKCVRPLLAEAGKDISQWFDEDTGDIRTYVHPITGAKVPYCPHGPLPHVPPQVPATSWRPILLPWWKDPQYEVGPLTKRVRPLKILNMLTCQEAYINVCCEDTILRITERYSIFNRDGLSYTWLYGDKQLHMDKNLEENGVVDERDSFTALGLPHNTHVPLLYIYYNDDFKYESI
ncbi:cytochrome b5 domain-containing protein 1 [Photinus pyralis]|uniref:cytochrome b5 domain-containing protein 1 n=1 Tax=Photinus pyralis TaxID=7054 RepID=UPI001267713F|nr:cytochrome b5 domain-containing protein 1 [Photinus pyralis]